MSPTIVFNQGKPWLAIGSPGGSRIIGYVTNSLIGVMDWNLNLFEATNMPHVVKRFDTVDLERNTRAEYLIDPLSKRGHSVKVRDPNSGLHAIMLQPNKKKTLIGAADLRREGMVVGK